MDDEEIYYTFTSFTIPQTIYKYTIASGQSQVLTMPIDAPSLMSAQSELMRAINETREQEMLLKRMKSLPEKHYLNGLYLRLSSVFA